MIDKWQFLLAELEVIESPLGQEILTPVELQSFENETGITLPIDHKGFCQVFGTGVFDNEMRIFCPNLNISNALINALKYDVNIFCKTVYKTKVDVNFIKNLLDSAFIFGGNSNADIVFWDLRTYSISDKNYDIWWVNNDCFDGELYKVGRDFYEFVYNFCLGMESYEILPESKRPSPELLAHTFTRGSLKWLTDNYPNLDSWIN